VALRGADLASMQLAQRRPAQHGPDGTAGHRISPDEIVLCAAGDSADPELPARLLRHCRARLPACMVPAVVRILPVLPHPPNGKVDLVRLRAEVGECTGSP
jgi:hypothetical protein